MATNKNQNTQEFNITKLPIELQDLYYNSQVEYKEIIESIFNPEDGIQTNTENRPLPPYAKGSLDAPYLQGGMPIPTKARKLVNVILSGDYRFVEVEGGKRGSKDIWGLFAWAKYLMVCPERLHLALGSSLEHVLRTVLMSNGFGLYFLIPHGVFVRETINGAQRGVYKFLDNYGLEKQILFYGNEKENDKNKFQGFTLGSVYVNEALNQHPNGIGEADDRIASTRQPLIITTQNPQGEAHRFYQEVERPKLTTPENIAKMEYVRDHYKDQFMIINNKLLHDRDVEKAKIVKQVLNDFTVSSISELPNRNQVLLNETLLNVNYEFDKIIRNYSVEEFAWDYIFETDKEKEDWLNYKKDIERLKLEFEDNKNFDLDKELSNVRGTFYGKYKDKYLLTKSMASVVKFVRGGDNPNKVFNAYNFYYAHFNVDDNLYMTEMQRNNYKNSRAVGTAGHDQDIIGLRRSSDGAIYNTFTDKNIFSGDISKFDWEGKVRAIVIDPGFNHPTGMTDWAVDLSMGKAWCLQERKIDFNVEHLPKSLETIWMEYLKLVRGAKGRATPEYVIVDPSKPELIELFQERGQSVYPANNKNWTAKQKDKETSEEITARELRGIPLVQVAFAKLKYLIHENCIELIKEIGSYSYVKNEKGQDELPKLYDDLVVTVKYMSNTLGIRPSMWEYDDSEEFVNEQSGFSKNETREDSEWNLEEQFRDAFNPQKSKNEWWEEDQIFSEYDTDFFS